MHDAGGDHRGHGGHTEEHGEGREITTDTKDTKGTGKEKERGEERRGKGRRPLNPGRGKLPLHPRHACDVPDRQRRGDHRGHRGHTEGHRGERKITKGRTENRAPLLDDGQGAVPVVPEVPVVPDCVANPRALGPLGRLRPLGRPTPPSLSSFLPIPRRRPLDGRWHVAGVPRVQGELPPAGVQGAAPLAPLPLSFSFPVPFVPFVSFVSVVISLPSPCFSVCPPCPLWSPPASCTPLCPLCPL